MKNRVFLKIFTLLLVVCTIVIFTACTPTEDGNNEPPTHDDALTSKVVLFIGDGMGPNHEYNTELYYEESMYFSSFSVKTTVDTNSLSGVTDSSAAATAMATGERISNGKVAIRADKSSIVSITELAKRDQYGAGVVTSDDITGATPAGFSAHAKSRDNSAEILLSQKDSPIDLLLGAGSYSSAYESHFADKGWNWVKTYDQLSTENKRFVATFESVAYENGTDSSPTLTELASYAIDYMEANYPTGYFLMIEGARIDKESHSGDIAKMMKNQRDFSNAIKTVDQKLSATGSAYSLIVTADHETGGLQKANSKAEVTDALYTTSDHTDTKVNLYFKSTLATAPSILGAESILNTDIFLLCKELLAIK
ncbi:MAG: alkaline phosphatase [Clostridia bacterium]|nr:alkaline phosphatase [Clostridia bacterium]